MTKNEILWRVVRDPLGNFAVLSDISPGPRIGVAGELAGWDDMGQTRGVLSFEWAVFIARIANEVVRGSPNRS